MPKSPYNTTDLDPERTFERHVFHRDQLAHFLRWTFVLNRANIGDRVLDFGCGKGAMLEVLYRNRFRPEWYVGYDIRERTMRQATERYHNVPFTVKFFAEDLVSPDFKVVETKQPANRVASFEVVEHVGKQNVPQFLKNFLACSSDPECAYYLSTPNHDPHVGAAGNHTYDSGDGRGVAIHEWDHDDLNELIIETGFEIVEEFGTFASKRDYWQSLSDEDRALYERLKRYYDANLVSNIMAPLTPARTARNALRVMRRAG